MDQHSAAGHYRERDRHENNFNIILRPMIGLGLALPLSKPPGNTTPGGTDDVLLLADGTSGLLLADGSSFLILAS